MLFSLCRIERVTSLLSRGKLVASGELLGLQLLRPALVLVRTHLEKNRWEGTLQYHRLKCKDELILSMWLIISLDFVLLQSSHSHQLSNDVVFTCSLGLFKHYEQGVPCFLSLMPRCDYLDREAYIQAFVMYVWYSLKQWWSGNYFELENTSRRHRAKLFIW